MQFPELSDEELSKQLVHFAGPAQTAMAAELSRRQAVKAQQMLSGEDMYRALTSIVPEMVTKAPADHDVLIEAFGMMVLKTRFVEPHMGNPRWAMELGKLPFVYLLVSPNP